MCPYMIHFEGELPLCEPKKKLCTMCIAGDQKIFDEIEEEKKEEISKQISKFFLTIN